MKKPIHILYVDDNPLDRALVKDSLEREHGGFILTEAKSKKEFKNQISKKSFDLVLTDFNILGFEGLQVLEMVKTYSPKTPVIIVTGTGSEEVAVKAMKQGASDYVIKTPGHISRLPNTIILAIEAQRIRLERRKAKKALSKMNRIYRFISQINQLIVRTQNRDELFQELCHIAIKFGKFRMAWIGLLNEKKELKPFSWAGYEEGYLLNVNIVNVDESPEGNGPGGIALRTGKYALSNDIESDSRFSPWKNEALNRGYRSVMALPVKLKGKVIGTFNLYSDEVNFFDDKEIVLLEEVVNDISFALDSLSAEIERKNFEELLIQSERKFRTLADYTNDMEYWEGDEGKIIYMSPSCERLTGYAQSELVSKPQLLEKIVHFEDIDLMKEHLNIIHSNKEIESLSEVEFRIIQKNKKTIYVQHTCRPMFSEDNKYIGRRVTNRDITKQKNAELEISQQKEELKLALEKAQESDRLKSAFLANMSHEIRTPMNGILGFSELLKEPELTGDQQSAYIDIIEKSGHRMLNIINDIIDISKIESGQMEVHISETNVNKKIKYITKFFQPEAEGKGIQIIYNLTEPEQELIIQTDVEKLYAVLTNLVKNALKYTQEGKIEIGYQEKNKFLHFYVKDSGLGISPEHQKIIFERFRQGIESRTRKFEGAGLGLAITRAYVEMLGGKIWVESEEGKGSTFFFSLPY